MDPTLLISIVVALATVVLALLTYQLAVETRLLRKASTDPALAVHIEAGERHVNAIMLVIANVGRGAAYDVKWKVEPDPKTLEAYGVELRSLKLLDGMSQIVPGQRIVTFFGMAFGMLSGKACPAITLEAAYRDERGAPLKASFVLSPTQFKGLTRLGKSIGDDIADSLKALVKVMESVTGQGKLHVAASAEDPMSVRARRVQMTVGDDTQQTPEALPAITQPEALSRPELASEVPAAVADAEAAVCDQQAVADAAPSDRDGESSSPPAAVASSSPDCSASASGTA